MKYTHRHTINQRLGFELRVEYFGLSGWMRLASDGLKFRNASRTMLGKCV